MFSPYVDDNNENNDNNDQNDDNNDNTDNNDDDDVVDIADDAKVSFLSLFNSPLENVWKGTTVASLSDARHHVFARRGSNKLQECAH